MLNVRWIRRGRRPILRWLVPPAVAAATVSGLVVTVPEASATPPPAAFNLVGGAPVPTALGGNGANVALFSPDGSLFVTADQSLDQLSLYSVSANGTLTLAPGSPVQEGPNTGPASVAFSPNGQFLAVANSYFDGTVSVYAVAANGTLTPAPGSPYPVGSDISATAVTFSPDGSLLAVGNTGFTPDSSIGIYSVAADGGLTPVANSPFDLGHGPEPFNLSFNPSGTLLAVGDEANGSIGIWSVTTGGQIAEVPGSPFPAADSTGTDSLRFSSNGLLAATTWNTVAVYTVSAAGMLTAAPGSPLTVPGPIPGTTPVLNGVAWGPAGNLLAVTSNGGLGMLLYSVSTQGGLTPAPGSPYSLGEPPNGFENTPYTAGFSPHGFLATGNTACPVVPDGGGGACDIDSVSVFAPVPTAAIASPAGGQTYALGATVHTSFSCPDPYGAGIASCTDSNGGTAPSGSLNTANAGTFTYTVTALGQDGQSGSSQISYTVAKAPTMLLATPILRGGVSAKLTRSDTKAPVAGQAVTFTAGTHTLCTALTNASGTAACTSPLAVQTAIANHGYTATFAGSNNYLPSSDHGKLVGP